MTDGVQQLLTKLIDNAPTIIAAVASAWVVVWRSNKKTVGEAEKTNTLLASNSDKLGAVHEQVNGNFTALQAKLDAAVRENELLRAQVAKRRRRAKDAKDARDAP